MNTILDNIEAIKKLDSKNMLGSIQLLSAQVKEVWALGEKFNLPAGYKSVKKMVVLGMGGSSLCAHILSELYKSEIKIPIELVNDYHVPAYVDSQTLVIVSSYSGGTEEPINAVQEAKNKQAKIVAISSGGELASWAKTHKVPALVFSTAHNPCGSPRMGLGYTIFGHAFVWAKAGVIKFGVKEMQTAVSAIEKFAFEFGTTVLGEANPAKKMAQDIFGRSVWYFGSEHLSGSAHAAGNQMNENAKRFGGYFIIPELNHHLLEGMMHPQSNKNNLVCVLLESKLYDARVQKRYGVTKDVLKKNGIKFLSYQFGSDNRLAQVCEALALSCLVSYYSALLQGIDPTAIPFVDYFKEQLKK
ncbi:MAG: SIS domain-containing protein [Candidatus Magasanikbacteria bacterium]